MHMFLRSRFALICAIAVAAVLSAGAANYERQVELDRFGKARPAATLLPAPVKKPLDKGLLHWMAQSGILPRVQNDKR